MFSQLKTVVIVGATSGIGEAFARQFHGLGKKVIITGRRAERLSALQKELSGLETYQWDVSKTTDIGNHVEKLLKTYPDIDGVFLNAGTMKSYFWADPSGSTDEDVSTEIAINLTAPMVMMRHFVPALLEKAQSGRPVALFATTSGLGYVPVPLYSIYNGTKAALHQNLVTLRQQLGFLPEVMQKNFNVCEVAPPYVDTDLDAPFRQRNIQLQGGEGKSMPPMALKDYIDTTMKQLHETGPDGKMHKEVGTGFSEMGIKAWRGAFDPIFKNIHMEQS